MADKIITISISRGNVQVSVDKLLIKPTVNTLRFKCADGEFAVLFDNNRSPFTGTVKKALAAHNGASTPKLKIRRLTAKERKFPVNDRKNGASFKYGVVVMEAGTGKLLTLDPDIIIDDGGGGGG